MTSMTRILAAAAAIGSLAAPATAQYYQQPQTYPYPQQQQQMNSMALITSPSRRSELGRMPTLVPSLWAVSGRHSSADA